MALASIQVLKAAKSIVSGFISGDNLILQTLDGTQINAGNVRGPVGATGNTSGPAGGDLSGAYPNPSIAALAITDAKVAAANKDGNALVPSMRTIGSGPQQAMAGNDSRVVAASLDTGWTTLTTTATNGGFVYYRVRGQQLTLAFAGLVLTSALAAGSSLTVVTSANALPAAYRPAIPMYTSVFYGNAIGWGLLNTDGTVQVHASSGTLVSCVGTVSYPLGA